MSKSPWTMRWFKMHHNFDDPGKWTAEIDNDELGAWTRLLKCASKCSIRGTVQIEGGIAYSPEQIKAMIKTDKPYIDKWKKQGAITVKNGIIAINNWELYQCEQDRKDKSILKQTLKQTTQTDTTDLDLDLDKDKDKKENTVKIDFDSIMSKWNTLPIPKGKLSKFTDSRKEKFKKRLTEGMDFDTILTKIKNSSFLLGNKSDWVITFDWLIKNSENFVKVMEGNYDDKVEAVETVVETKDYDITDFDDKALTIQGEKFEQKEYNTQKEKWARRQYLKKIGANK